MKRKEMEIDSIEFEQRVLETVKKCQERKEPPLIWATEIIKCVGCAGLELPSAELGQVLVSHLCFANNNPFLWKFIDQALSNGILSPLQLLSLLTSRVIPHRQLQPEAYRLYLELLSQYAFSYGPVGADACRAKIIKSVIDALPLSQTYRFNAVEIGHALVLFFFSIVIGLIDSTLEDWGLQMTSVDKPSGAIGGLDHQNMDICSKEEQNFQRNEHREKLKRTNSFMAMEVLGKLTESRKAMVLLHLVHLNMPEKFNDLLQRIQFLEVHISASSNLKPENQLLSRLTGNIKRVLGFKYQSNKHQLIGMLIDIGSHKAVSHCNYEAGISSCWVPFDMFMENAMDAKQLHITSAIDVLAETINTLRVFNRASWQETFLALWLSALRLVQRERDPLEGPVPHLETRLSVLLCIVPLAIAHVIDDVDSLHSSSLQGDMVSGCMETSRKHALISSLQILGQFSVLLCPPSSVASAATIAAAKAANFKLNLRAEKDGLCVGGYSDASVKIGGNMRHLIVEACIARKLIDTSAYFWSDYVSNSVISLPDTLPVQKSPWSTFMEGTSLNGPLVNALITTPASSLAEIEKLYHIALNGPEEEKSAAAKILCGASLSRGWNIQEHVVRCVVKLLSPPSPPNFTGTRSHLVDYKSMLNAVLFGASSIDTVHTLSLHGVVPEIAASLMPLCEVFGSLVPTSGDRPSTEDVPSIYMIFSSAFLFLLRLWKFYRPPLEQSISGRVGGELTLEYLLLLRNSRVASQNSAPEHETSSEATLDKPVYIHSYPKLRAWYCQNRSCIASTLSGLCSGNPVHEVANTILNMIYWKMTKTGTSSSGNPSTPSSSSISDSPASTGDDAGYQRPILPAWEVLEALPFVLEAILTACAHGRLSSRDLTTGLRDLVDFLPASLATIVSYFSAEVTRGIWKPVLMNGKDWPSPAANLLTIESEIKEILAAAGVNVPSCSSEVSSAMLPLPMAVLVSLTITFKLDKSLEYILACAGPALENIASCCPWPSMPIVSSLWAQKIRRWHDFIVVSCSRSVFRQNKEAVAQLLTSCFTSFLGSPKVSTAIQSGGRGGVNGLLGSVISAQGVSRSIAPGFLYLRSCRTIQNIQYVNDVIIKLVTESTRELSASWTAKEFPPRRLKSSRASLSLAVARVKEVATLGSSLLCVAGGIQLVQELYQETIPTWLLSKREVKLEEVSAVSHIMEGYAMAYLLILSGSFVWGVGDKPPSWAFCRRVRVVGGHMDFVAGVLGGNISLGCDPATWKAYVSCLVGLMVSFAPAWIREVKMETLRKLANGLRGWHECELALSLLERGGAAGLGPVAELINVIN